MKVLNNYTLIMRFVIIGLLLLLVGCAVVPMSKKPDIILTTRGHGEENIKDPN